MKQRGNVADYIRSCVPELNGAPRSDITEDQWKRAAASNAKPIPPEELEKIQRVVAPKGPSDSWLRERSRVLRPEHGPKAESVARKEWAAL